MKKTATLACVAAICLSGALTPDAHAQTASTELSSGSSKNRGNIDYERDPNDPNIKVPPKSPTGSAYTGSAPLSLGLAFGLTILALQIAVDAIPPLRQAVDDAAEEAGLSWVHGSSAGNRIFDFPAWAKMAQQLQANMQMPR